MPANKVYSILDQFLEMRSCEAKYCTYFVIIQRQLKRARLADNLREKLEMRPGPIELIRAKILQPDSDDGLVDAIETGAIQYQGTPGGQQLLHQVKYREGKMLTR